MSTLELVQRLYLIHGLIKDSQNIKSSLFEYLHSYPHQSSILSFSQDFRNLLTSCPPFFAKDKDNRLTTRFASYLEAFHKLCEGHLKAMIDYLECHKDVKLFLCKGLPILERLYYDFYGRDRDVILLDEFQLEFDEEFKIIQITKANEPPTNIPLTEKYKSTFFKGASEKKHENPNTIISDQSQELKT